MKKTEFRENIFKMLFAALYHTDEESAEQAALYIDTLGNISEKNKENLVKKYEGVLAHREEIDGWINEKAEGWDTQRMARADLCALRLGIYEMVFDEDVAVKVAMSEAVNIISEFGTEKSPDFVNGILAAVNKDEKIEKCKKTERVIEATMKAEGNE
ncbi:MAG: transcription antitermination factor NusB [Lachnospiraceae bacterium]|nr:transcription antitermination factor NusB [Lachnospiraceae bacterium]